MAKQRSEFAPFQSRPELQNLFTAHFGPAFPAAAHMHAVSVFNVASVFVHRVGSLQAVLAGDALTSQ
jgi:hypothetical protein